MAQVVEVKVSNPRSLQAPANGILISEREFLPPGFLFGAPGNTEPCCVDALAHKSERTFLAVSFKSTVCGFPHLVIGR